VKKQEVKAVKDELVMYKAKKQNEQNSELQAKRSRMQNIRGQLQTSVQHVKDFRIRKQNQLKDQFKERTEAEKRLIYQYELEAQDLERVEEQLI